MSAEAILLNPVAWKYIDLAVMSAMHLAFQRVNEMTDEELDAEIARLEVEAEGHDDWIAARLKALEGDSL